MNNAPIPPNATACLLLADGKIFFGKIIGANKTSIGEICFNTGLVGYQETLTDPSYAGQIITFTFPHIGNVGCNVDDIEAEKIFASGLVIRENITEPSNFRSQQHLNDWLIANEIIGICGVDTRALTRHIRQNGAQNAMIFSIRKDEFATQLEEAREELRGFPNMVGMELAKNVSTTKPYQWTQGEWKLNQKSQTKNAELYHVVAIDYGEKLNILRCLAERNCKITVVPSDTSAEKILKYQPDGIFLSNGPGDPAATSEYAVPILKELIASDVPIFGICLGHQLLARALGGKTAKMPQGHRGANHPVKNLATGAVEITSQNHGFAVLAESLPAGVIVTHTSLFDGTVEGLRVEGKPIFSVQYHPESSPGPHDSTYLFDEFVKIMSKK
ncbi:MAG: glutamine-hydrolyzing carbamoyl-phosphate synthase small subunit [Rickettsiales bacterium]|jgi:carbamoyl-phosphate synthase small subunit